MRRAAILAAAAGLVAVCSSGGANGSSPSRLPVTYPTTSVPFR